jgi:hypothetical protein
MMSVSDIITIINKEMRAGEEWIAYMPITPTYLDLHGLTTAPEIAQHINSTEHGALPRKRMSRLKFSGGANDTDDPSTIAACACAVKNIL